MPSLINRALRKLMALSAPIWPDKLFLQISFRLRMGKSLNLRHPVTYSEKLQWLKLNDRKPEYSLMVDKFAVKDFVASKIGQEHIIPTLQVWDNVEDVDIDSLPSQFVLKCNHDCGGMVFCKDKDHFDLAAAKRKLRKAFSKTYYAQNREWPYKNVAKKVFAEKYMVDESGYELKDYKFFCFDGVPRLMFIASDRENPDVETKFDFYDMDFNHLPIINGHPNSKKQLARPSSFEKMKELAAVLSKGLPQVRIDFYDINGQVYFGEITFFHWSGMKPFEPEEWDYKLGQYINL